MGLLKFIADVFSTRPIREVQEQNDRLARLKKRQVRRRKR